MMIMRKIEGVEIELNTQLFGGAILRINGNVICGMADSNVENKLIKCIQCGETLNEVVEALGETTANGIMVKNVLENL